MNPRTNPPIALQTRVRTACQSNPLAAPLPGVTAPLTQTPTTTQTQPSPPLAQTATNSQPAPQTYDLQVNERQVVMRLTQISFANGISINREQQNDKAN